MSYLIEVDDDANFTLQLRIKNETQIYSVYPENGLLHDTVFMQLDALINILVMSHLDEMMDTSH